MGCGQSEHEYQQQHHQHDNKVRAKRIREILERNMQKKKRDPNHYYTVIHPSEPESEGEMAAEPGDRLKYISVLEDQETVLAINQRTGQKGYVALSNLELEENTSTLKDNPWWFDGTRDEAEMVLIHNYTDSATGIYLIRQSSDDKNYVLSVRDDTNGPFILHARIYGTPEEGYVYRKLHFRTIPELIEYFKEDAVLGILLTKPYSEAKSVPKLKDIRLRREDIRIGRMLGAGYFGEVWEGELNKVLVAVKVLKEGSMTQESFLSEARVMNKLRHRRLVQLMGVCVQNDQTLIVMEFMANGPLLGYLKERRNTYQDYVMMAMQICEGMKFLETQNFIHRDLRAANVLVNDGGDLKVADFGLARVLSDEQIYTVSNQTPLPVKWTAPEGFKSQTFSSKSDVWSFGILLYEVITNGEDPYPGLTGPEVVREVNKGYQMPCPNVAENVAHSFYPIMVACWSFKPNNRPSFGTLYREFYSLSSQLT